MDRPFTSSDLRFVAKQAMALAYMDFKRDTRETLLRTADRLLEEADALENDELHGDPDAEDQLYSFEMK